MNIPRIEMIEARGGPQGLYQSWEFPHDDNIENKEGSLEKEVVLSRPDKFMQILRNTCSEIPNLFF